MIRNLYNCTQKEEKVKKAHKRQPSETSVIDADDFQEGLVSNAHSSI